MKCSFFLRIAVSTDFLLSEPHTLLNTHLSYHISYAFSSFSLCLLSILATVLGNIQAYGVPLGLVPALMYFIESCCFPELGSFCTANRIS